MLQAFAVWWRRVLSFSCGWLPRLRMALEWVLAGCALTRAPWISWKQAAAIRSSAGKGFGKKLYKTHLSMCCVVVLYIWVPCAVLCSSSRESLGGILIPLCILPSGLMCLGKYKPLLFERSKGKNIISLTLNFIPSLHVFLQHHPLLHMNYVNYSNYVPNAQSGKPVWNLTDEK